MMKIRLIISLFASMAMLTMACTEDFDEINTDPKNLTVDQLDRGTFGLVFLRALYEPVYVAESARGPFQLGHSLFADIYANYFATTAPNFDSDRFTLVGRWLDGNYNYFYSNAAPLIKNVEDFSLENAFNIENAMIKVWKVYAYHRITDFWGPIPFSNFGNLELSVPYDSQEDIYNLFFDILDEALAVLNANAGTTSFVGSKDVIFGGDVDSWIIFANTLRLRLAIRVKYADPALAQAEAEKAVNAGVMISNEQNAFVATRPNFRNGYNTITQWGEFRMSADMESILKGYHDPRVEMYFAAAALPDPEDDPDNLIFNFEGMRNGQSKADKQGTDFNSLASDMAGPFTVEGDAGPSWPVMKASEAYFLRAEGALEGWAMGGTAQEFYEMGIATSHEEYGLDGNDLLGNPYLQSDNTPSGFDSSTPAVSTVPVAFDAGASPERQLEQIITQKWIALYPDSYEAWAERRRTGYPTLYDRLFTDDSTIPVNNIPRRVPYVTSEFDTNREAVEDAIANLLGGPNEGTTRLWWDVKP